MGSLNLKIIYRFLGLTAVLNGVFMFIAFPFSMFHQETAQMGILNAGIVTIFIGLILEGILSRIVLLTHISKTHRRKLPYRQSLVLGFDSLREGDAIG